MPVIDLGHEIPPFDIEAGAAMLVRCAPYLGSGVVLAVVDPGVGTDRRGVAIEAGGPGPSWLVGPDNGLLVPLARALGGVRRVIVLRPPNADAPGSAGSVKLVGRTFDGRDVFAPAAAHLSVGGPPLALGSEVDPTSLVWPVPDPAGGERRPTRAPVGRSTDQAPKAADGGTDPARSQVGAVTVAVSRIDRFGNVQLATGPGAMDEIGVRRGGGVVVTLGGPAGRGPRPAGRTVERSTRSEPARWVRAYGDLGPGELGLLIDSSERLSVVLHQASAADFLGPITVGDVVGIVADPAPDPPG